MESSPSFAAARLPSYNVETSGGWSSTGLWDPVAVLPPELAAMCLRAALPWDGTYPAILLELTSVCIKWQRFLFSIPSLWSEIYIDSSAHDLEAITALFAQLSCKTRIKLILWTVPGQEWDAVKSALLPHTRRLHSIILGEHPISRLSQEKQILLVAEVIDSLNHAPIAEVDFGHVLVFEPSQLRALSLPLHIRVTSPIEVSLHLHHGGFRSLFLTRFTSEDSLVHPLVLPGLLRNDSVKGLSEDNIVTLNTRIETLRHILDLLSRPLTISNETLANSPCAIFIEKPGDRCRICGDRKESLEAVMGCLRFHFGHHISISMLRL